MHNPPNFFANLDESILKWLKIETCLTPSQNFWLALFFGVKLSDNTKFMIKCLDFDFKLSKRDFYDKKLISMEIQILQENKR